MVNLPEGVRAKVLKDAGAFITMLVGQKMMEEVSSLTQEIFKVPKVKM